MITLEAALEIIKKSFGEVAVSAITELPDGWSFSLTSPKGLPYDMPPVAISKEDGSFLPVDPMAEEPVGVQIAVPEAFMPQKDLVYQYLYSDSPEKNDTNIWLNVLFYSSNILDCDFGDMYAIGRWFLSLVDSVATDEERKSAYLLQQNEIICEFLNCSIEEKLSRAADCYWVPDYVKAFEEKTQPLLLVAMEKMDNKDKDLSAQSADYQAFAEEFAAVLKQLENEDTIVCNKEKLKAKMETLLTQIRKEIDYINSQSDEPSERMTKLAQTAQDESLFNESVSTGFSQPKNASFSKNVVFGEEA